jgi:multiple sugar transport system ATP-binding protein
MVFQNYALYPHMTVFDNMAFGLKLRKTPKEEIRKRVEEAAKILDIGHLLDRKPKALSGGQRQRVALGRAIVREPKVFLMDEPLSNLDAKLRVQMRIEISKLHQDLQTTIIYVTHDQTEALTMGTRIVVMKDSFIQQIDTPLALYDNPQNVFVAGFIGSPQMNFINAVAEKDEKDGGVCVRFFNNTLKLPEAKAKKLLDGGYIGKEVIFGIRPEDVHDEEQYLQKMPGNVLNARVDVIGMLGSETLLYTHVGEVGLNARVNPRIKVKVGDSISLAVDTGKAHVFDKETERVITN